MFYIRNGAHEYHTRTHLWRAIFDFGTICSLHACTHFFFFLCVRKTRAHEYACRLHEFLVVCASRRSVSEGARIALLDDTTHFRRNKNPGAHAHTHTHRYIHTRVYAAAAECGGVPANQLSGYLAKQMRMTCGLASVRSCACFSDK